MLVRALEQAVKLTPLFSYYANLSGALSIGAGMHGNRMIVEVDGGEFEGALVRGLAVFHDRLLLSPADSANGNRIRRS